jgi:sporulation protein YlmC with PRC-barrel domain
MGAADRRTEDFHLGAAVYSSDGKHVGAARRTLVDESDFKLHALVVEESKVFKGHLLAPGALGLEDDLVVPIGFVRNVTHDRIDLFLTSAEVRHLPPYLSYRPATLTAGGEFAGWTAAFGGNPAVFPTEELASRLKGEIEIDAGENVMIGDTGSKLGHVKDVLFDETELIGVVVEPEGFFKKPVVLPRRFLRRSDDLALFVDLTEDEARNLELFKPTD